MDLYSGSFTKDVYFSCTDYPRLLFIFLYKLLTKSTSEDFSNTVSGFAYFPGDSFLWLNILYFYFKGPIFGSRDLLQVVSKGASEGGIKHLILRIGEKDSKDINNFIRLRKLNCRVIRDIDYKRLYFHFFKEGFNL